MILQLYYVKKKECLGVENNSNIYFLLEITKLFCN